MTTESHEPLPVLVRRALATETIEEMAAELTRWPRGEVEQLAEELRACYDESRQRLTEEYLAERERTCFECRLLLDTCFRQIQRHFDRLYGAIADTITAVLVTQEEIQ